VKTDERQVSLSKFVFPNNYQALVKQFGRPGHDRLNFDLLTVGDHVTSGQGETRPVISHGNHDPIARSMNIAPDSDRGLAGGLRRLTRGFCLRVRPGNPAK
jgi:hypothetical protein